MSIAVTPGEIISDALQKESSSHISFSDTGYIRPTYIYSLAGGYHQLTVSFPMFDTWSQYAGYSNWKLKFNLDVSGTAFPLISLNPGLQVPSTFKQYSFPEPTNGKYVFTQSLIPGVSSYFLAPGTWFNALKCYITAIDLSGAEVIVAERNYPITSVITTDFTPYLNVSYFGMSDSGIVVAYQQGSGVLSTKNIFVTTNSEFTATVDIWDELISIETHDTSTDSYFKTLELIKNPDVSEPSPGVFDGNITVQNDSTVFNIPIRLIVVAPSSLPVYLSPDNISLTAVLGQGNTSSVSSVVIVSNNDWEVSGIPEWLIVSETSGNGTTVIYLNADITNLSAGSYSTVIDFGSGALLSVSLSVRNFMESPFSANGLYFCKDLDYLKFFTTINDTRVEVSLSIKIYRLRGGGTDVYTRTYGLSFFNGATKFHPGNAIEQLFASPEFSDVFIDLFEAGFVNQYTPAEVTISYAEKRYSDDSIVMSGFIPSVRFMLGNNPGLTSNNTAIYNVVQQNMSRITANSLIDCCFSVYFPTILFFKINGVVKESFTIFPSGDFTNFHYFRTQENLKPGDVVEIMLKDDVSRTRRLLVFPPGKESTYIFFLNSNGMPECYEFTGRRRLQSSYTHNVRQRYKDLYTYPEKQNSVNQQTVVINSGYLLPVDHRIVDAIIKSKYVWLSFDTHLGPYYSVDATTSKIVNADTEVPEVSFDVEFNILDNADVSIYLQ